MSLTSKRLANSFHPAPQRRQARCCPRISQAATRTGTSLPPLNTSRRSAPRNSPDPNSWVKGTRHLRLPLSLLRRAVEALRLRRRCAPPSLAHATSALPHSLSLTLSIPRSLSLCPSPPPSPSLHLSFSPSLSHSHWRSPSFPRSQGSSFAHTQTEKCPWTVTMVNFPSLTWFRFYCLGLY